MPHRIPCPSEHPRLAPSTGQATELHRPTLAFPACLPALRERVPRPDTVFRKGPPERRQISLLSGISLRSGKDDGLNKRWHEYTGLSAEESCGWGWQSAIHPEDRALLTEKWRALVVIGEPGEMEARLRRYEGVFRWFLMRVEPLRDET